MTYLHSQQNLFGDESEFLRDPRPASRSAKPDNEKVQPMNGTSFRSFFEWHQNANRDGSLLKTLEACLVSNLETYSRRIVHRWKVLVTPSKRFVFQLAPSTRHIVETDYGLLLDFDTTMLATPQSRDYRSPGKPDSGNFQRKMKAGWTIDLNSQIAMLTTPNAQDAREVPAALRPSRAATGRTTDYLSRQIAMLPTPRTRGLLGGTGSKEMMQSQVDAGVISQTDANGLMGLEMLPTPRANDPEKCGNFDVTNPRNGLPAAIGMLSTPCASDYKGSGSNETVPDRLDYDIEKSQDGAKTGLKLQPAFVLWMLGFPTDWCDLEDGE